MAETRIPCYIKAPTEAHSPHGYRLHGNNVYKENSRTHVPEAVTGF
ncbi:MAG: hypothetical protein JRF64_10810 [Deltaproteobacteria bacterium]|nr:hypothetical protein [Deltaproteobacteria bacterium]